MDKFINAFENSLNFIFEHSTSLIQAILFLGVGYIIARIATKGFRSFSLRMQTNSLEKAAIDYLPFSLRTLFSILEAFLFWLIFLFFVIAYIHMTDIPFLNKVLNWSARSVPNILAGASIFIIGYVCSIAIKKAFLSKFNNSSNKYLLSGTAQILTMGTTIILVLEQVGIKSEPIVVIFSVVIFCILFGMALLLAHGSKDIINNFLSSQMLSIDIKVGDILSVAEHTGEVIEVGRLHITMQRNGELIRIPSTYIINNIVSIKEHKSDA